MCKDRDIERRMASLGIETGTNGLERLFTNTLPLPAGHFQVPCLEDPNAGVYLFESAAIIDYLKNTYGKV